jgi:F-type H+-transporting ATPase subunit epsilon
MAENKLKLSVVTQEKKLVSVEVDSVTAPTSTGEITILPNHIPILSELQTGELIYRHNGETVSIVISKGFLNLQPGNELTIIVDNATHERDISIEKAQAAIKAAHETMVKTADERELLLAEASLRRAMWEMKVAEKSRKTKI